MLRVVVMGLYTALLLGANPAHAGVAEAQAALAGDMRKLVFAEAPTALPDVPVIDGGDQPHSLAEWQGKWVVLNFWATWCAPCRHEMPSLDRLQAAMPEIAVVPVATGRNSVTAIEKFYGEAGVTSLPILRDPKSELARGHGRHGPAGDGDPEPRGAGGRPADRRRRLGQRRGHRRAAGAGRLGLPARPTGHGPGR